MSQRTTVNPEVHFLDDVVNNIVTGRYTIPAFQRKYVWQKSNIIDLFDSIYKGFPIGAVLLWKTALKITKSIDNQLPKNDIEGLFVLDGQQRLTTLYKCLINRDFGLLWDLKFDLDKSIFFYEDDVDSMPDNFFSVKMALQTSDFLKESSRIYEKTKSDEYVEKCQFFANLVRKYKISVINLEGGGIDDAIEIFTRLNRTGIQIKPVDIIRALNYSNDNLSSFEKAYDKFLEVNEDFNFFSNSKDAYVEERSDYSDIFLKIIRISLGFPLYSEDDTMKLSDSIKSDNFERSIDNILNAYKKTLEFLIENKFYRYEQLPYVNLIYMIFVGFYGSLVDNRFINKYDLIYNLFASSVSGLPNVSPSGTEKILLYFKNGFDKSLLTKKMKQLLETDYFKDFCDKIEEGSFNSQSAHGKVLYNIVLKHCIDSDYVRIDKLCYPPMNVSKDKSIRNRLGNKRFFADELSEVDSGIYSANLASLESRERDLSTLSKCFFDSIRLAI
ncbi:DUF262 domain-containing protein [Rheinheimera sp.]|uniref:DUF262 domain-containing protein n=1 Tax=Rheinheimera sp. TaxID=1869214 RepID=UPI00307F0451